MSTPTPTPTPSATDTFRYYKRNFWSTLVLAMVVGSGAIVSFFFGSSPIFGGYLLLFFSFSMLQVAFYASRREHWRAEVEKEKPSA